MISLERVPPVLPPEALDCGASHAPLFFEATVGVRSRNVESWELESQQSRACGAKCAG
jgi:hypothetical protein